MKRLSIKASKILLVSSLITAGVVTLGMNINSFKTNDDESLNLIKNEISKVQNANSITGTEESENIQNTDAEIKKATEAQEIALNEAKIAEDSLNQALDARKKAEAEVKAAKTPEERKVAEKKVKEAELAVQKAEEVKKASDEKVKEAEENVKNAIEVQKEIKKEPVKETIETKVENKTETSKQNTSNETQKSSESNNAEKKSNNSLTEEQLKYMLEQAKKGEALQQQEYREAYYEKYGKYPEEEKSNVEFHFYSTMKTITIHRNESKTNENYWSGCGVDGRGCIWFADFSCDMNACEGFVEPGSGSLKNSVRIGRRGDILEYTMEAPKAKPGYKFKQWEIISANKNITNTETPGILISKYIAIYEKV